ncbi:alpha/beta fold hydrolase [Phenylobacterium sp. NIBR 498073]|uniref:alpha/beta hydrolase family protein n=1 Tax=Phenylobacterium sp. NIBR 498073 TaxID=3015177 RepID=UPI0022B5AEC7|nr:alpha/beta fold hydrolase [Phenylobacterium sp. NIBR 498073]MBS0490025.1 alpha/beta fold hydrolase [Pseudomonadota bacterium]WGU39061.1 alpha/beta fold hydrolase [Phenylobacterium sp. NIBR 498073]
MKSLLLTIALLAPASTGAAQTPPPQAVVADPTPDKDFPAYLQQTRYRTAGVDVPARWFTAAGKGPHPSVLLLHGFPGTELNLDLARSIQRAGWNVMAIHYRGAWGAPGQFSFGNTIEDARAALTWLRHPSNADKVDASRLIVLGHSMGGFDTVMLGDEPVAGFIVISAADLGGMAATLDTPTGMAEAIMALTDDARFTNAAPTALADEVLANAQAWDWRTNAAEMAGRPALIISSDDGNEPADQAVADAIEAAGGPKPARVRFPTDHSYNDHRIALQAAVVGWLQATFR